MPIEMYTKAETVCTNPNVTYTLSVYSRTHAHIQQSIKETQSTDCTLHFKSINYWLNSVMKEVKGDAVQLNSTQTAFRKHTF